MLHDIAPHVLKNEYIEVCIRKNDKVIVFDGRRVLMLQDEVGKWNVPYLEQCEELCSEREEQFRYLFQIDSCKYYLYIGDFKVSEAKCRFFWNVRSFRNEDRLPREERFGILTAWHLHSWYQENRVCGSCGKRLIHATKERMLFCESCKRQIFPKIAPAVIVAVTDGDRILMSKYAGREYTGYALLAGFVEIGETPEQTVEREVMEEVGLKVKNIRYYKSQPGGIDSNLLLGFYCELDGTDRIKMDETELSMANWYARNEIPVEDNDYSLTFEMIGRFKNHPEYFERFKNGVSIATKEL